jgi:hypothetical protein
MQRKVKLPTKEEVDLLYDWFYQESGYYAAESLLQISTQLLKVGY